MKRVQWGVAKVYDGGRVEWWEDTKSKREAERMARELNQPDFAWFFPAKQSVEVFMRKRP